jgi:hypothetical protein
MLKAIYDLAPGSGLFIPLLLMIALAAAAAWRTGQAVAESWGALWPVVAYTLLIAAGVRFLHYALFQWPLLSPDYFLADFAVLVAFALAGHRVRRARHMTEQYPWLFQRAGPLGWRPRRGR